MTRAVAPAFLSPLSLSRRVIVAAVVAAAVALFFLAFASSAARAQNTPVDRLDVPAPALSAPTTALLQDVAARDGRLIAVGGQGLVILSEDGGDTWRQSPTPSATDLTAVAIGAEGVVLAVGHDGLILRSEDHGDSWGRVADGRDLFKQTIAAAQTAHARAKAAVAAADDDAKRNLERDLDDEVYRLETAQLSLEYGPSWPLLDVAFLDPGGRRALAVGAYGSAFLSEDQGETWRLVNSAFYNPDNFHLNAVFRTGTGALLIAAEAGVLFRSTDGLRTTDRVDTPDGLSLFGFGPVDGGLVAFGFGDRAQISTDDGATWRSVRLTEGAVLIGGAPLPGGRFGAVGSGGLMVTFGLDGEIGRSRPLGTRAFLSGAWVRGDGGALFIGEAGVGAAPADGSRTAAAGGR